MPISSQAEMAMLLARQGRFMRAYARKWLGAEATEDAVEDIVGRAVERLLAIEQPSFHDGKRQIRLVIRQEYERSTRELAEAAEHPTPYDPFLGRLVGPVLDAVRKLNPRYQRVILKTAQHLTDAEIAEAEGVSPGAIRARRHYARRRAMELLREVGKAAPALLVAVPRRFRATRLRDVDTVMQQSGAAASFVPLLVLVTAATAPTGSVPALGRPARAAITTLATAGALPRVAQPHVDATPASTSVRPAVVPAGRGVSVGALSGAAAETPDDVTLTAIASPADGRPVLVAIGTGKTCNCSVLMRSLDGGASWESTDGPPLAANQLVVPPAYPRDPRIFAGVPAVSGGAPYMTLGFRQPFAQVSGLPAGQVAVSAHFDDGDPRLFSAGQTAVWSVPIGGPSPLLARDELDYSAASTTTHVVGALATPAPAPGAPAVLAWAPPLATAPGSLSGASTQSTLMRCPVAAPCTAVGLLPAFPWRLETHGSATVVAYGATAAYVSSDSGTSFGTLALPSGASTLNSLALVGDAGTPWISFERADGTDDVARLAASGETWFDAAGDSQAARTHLGILVPVGTDRIIEQFTTLGYRCTTIFGGSWAARCPSQ